MDNDSEMNDGTVCSVKYVPTHAPVPQFTATSWASLFIVIDDIGGMKFTDF